MKMILSGVRHMHANNIVHRDLKPGNCLLDDKFQLNIIDFGLAIESKNSIGADGMLLGTPLFMAPEIFTSRGAVDSYKEPVDIWACGIIMFNLISNGFPFYDNDRH
jgi:calcium-dependent protein kinase